MVTVLFSKIGLWPAAGLKILYVALGLKSLPTTGIAAGTQFFNFQRRYSSSNTAYIVGSGKSHKMCMPSETHCSVFPLRTK